MVVKPVEGTILTVVRRAAEGVEKHQAALSHPLEVLKKAWSEGKKALDETPEMLPMLKQAGVVDSGGLGFLRVLEGVIAAFEGKALPEAPKITSRAQEAFENEEFGYCTEFLIEGSSKSAREIQELVSPFGDSLLVVGAEGYVKGHIHTEEPEKLLSLVARYGKMIRSKVEDMSQQHSEILEEVDLKSIDLPKNGLVAVSSGYGITKVFRSLGARVVGGGQSNNPSVEDIADAVRTVPAETVFVLPNNKNIIMAAKQVSQLVKDKRVKVIETRTLGQGLAAAVNFQDRLDSNKLLERLNEAARSAITLEVTTASRSATIDGVAVKDGQYIGLIDGKLKVADEDAKSCLKALFEEVADEVEIATLFYNNNFDAEEIENLVEDLIEDFGDLDFEAHPGSPDLYHFVVALE
ncbi:MAG: DAK2 domain-containing protein [Deinococcales bacterium]